MGLIESLQGDGRRRPYELWLVCGAMVAVGLLLVDRGMRLAWPACPRLAR